MKIKVLAVLAACAMVFAFTYSASAMMTTDVVFVNVGYVPTYSVSYDDDQILDGVTIPGSINDDEFKGYAAKGEYNLNMSPMWLGFGFEWQRLVHDDNSDVVVQFLIPQVTAKFVTDAGFYLGAGVAGKYLMSYSAPSGSDTEPDKKIDLWANGIVGFFMPIAEGVFFDVQGRFGYNVTNSQWKSVTSGGSDYEFSPSSAYDMAIYVGIGFRATASGIQIEIPYNYNNISRRR